MFFNSGGVGPARRSRALAPALHPVEHLDEPRGLFDGLLAPLPLHGYNNIPSCASPRRSRDGGRKRDVVAVPGLEPGT